MKTYWKKNQILNSCARLSLGRGGPCVSKKQFEKSGCFKREYHLKGELIMFALNFLECSIKREIAVVDSQRIFRGLANLFQLALPIEPSVNRIHKIQLI